MAKPMHDKHDEMIDVVDEHDTVLESLPKEECYQRKLRPRIVNIAVIDPVTRNIAIQQRGLKISWQPGFYCVSACGHVGAGEAWADAAKRELFEEIGLDAPVTFMDKFPYTDESGKDFMLGVFTAEASHDILKADPFEVSSITSMTVSEIENLIGRDQRLHNLFKPVLKKVIENLQ